MKQQTNYVLEIHFDWTDHTYSIKDPDGRVLRSGIESAGEAVEQRLELEGARTAS